MTKPSFVLLLATLTVVYGGLVEDFNKVLADLNIIKTEANYAYGNFSRHYIKKVSNNASFHFWNVVDPRYSASRQSMINDVNSFKKNELTPQTDSSTQESKAKIKDISDEKIAPDLMDADDKLKDFMAYSTVEGKKLIDLAEKADGKLKEFTDTDKKIEELINRVDAVVIEDPEVKKLKKTLYLITRQIQNMQFNEEEKTRSDGNSGIKQIRTRFVGEKSYHSSSHTGRSFSAIHDHSNNKRICGMGEFIGVLNGVEFRTRHNDFSLRSPAFNDPTFNKAADLKFPNVPPKVLNKPTVDEQIDEMVEWFRAFKNQDYSKRDYRKYFKPILCYLEGAWTTKEGDNIDEPFASDRHHIDAKSWFELQEKIRFTSYSGTKDLLENLAWLPTSIMGFDANGKPSFAQWNYRIMCHALKNDLPTKYLKPILDPHSQKMNSWNDEKFETTRAIRFDLEGIDCNGKRKDSPQRYTLLDSLMEEIPGKNNYGSFIPAQGFDANITSANPTKQGQRLNGAYYHRPYRLDKADAMGVQNTQRTFSDRLYVAMTTQDRIAGPSFKDSKGKVIRSKVSYAIPMEIIYLTPLAKWNPYNITYDDVTKLTGGGGENNPYSHSNRKTFFHTPSAFFTGTVETDSADTSKDGVYIKNSIGDVVKTEASGVRIMFPKIADISGLIRQRYPIMPIYGEGSTFWKRLNAFEDSMGDYQTHVDKTTVYYIVGHSHSDIKSDHTHTIQITLNQYKALSNDKSSRLTITTTKAISHTHDLIISVNDKNQVVVQTCDTTAPHEDTTVCFDHHPATLTKDT